MVRLDDLLDALLELAEDASEIAVVATVRGGDAGRPPPARARCATAAATATAGGGTRGTESTFRRS